MEAGDGVTATFMTADVFDGLARERVFCLTCKPAKGR